VAGPSAISNEDGTLWIVSMARSTTISLCGQLIARGHRYSTHSDTETVIHLYEEYGADCVQHLAGCSPSPSGIQYENFFIARDRRASALYYKLTPERLLFGSEIKAWLAHGGISRGVQSGALRVLAFGYLSGEESFYAGIPSAARAHDDGRSEGKAEIRQYWTWMHRRAESRDSELLRPELSRVYWKAQSTATDERRALGVFLSGGVDSSAVAALMTKLRREPV